MQTRDRLQDLFGKYQVRLSLDDYASSVFWYLVLHRPIVFDSRSTLAENPGKKTRGWTAYDLTLHPKLRTKLARTDLGLVYDEENNWLSLIWPEAVGKTGILNGFKKCPSWAKILENHAKYTSAPVPAGWWKTCARTHAGVVPDWKLRRMHYVTSKLWHRPGLSVDDIIVFDVAWIDLPKLDQEGRVVLPVAHRADFTHFYTDNEREYRAARVVAQRKEWMQEQRYAEERYNTIRSARWRRLQKEKRYSWHQASRTIGQMLSYIGKNIRNGRAPIEMTEEDSDLLFNTVCTRYYNGEFPNPRWKRIDASCLDLEKFLADPTVPRRFKRWLAWKDEARELKEEFSCSL